MKGGDHINTIDHVLWLERTAARLEAEAEEDETYACSARLLGSLTADRYDTWDQRVADKRKRAAAYRDEAARLRRTG